VLTFNIEERVNGCRQLFQFDYLRLYNIVPKFLNLISDLEEIRYAGRRSDDFSWLTEKRDLAESGSARSDDFSWLTDLESKYLNIIFLFPRRSQVFLNICKNYRSRRDIS